jgi:hypothetical protein
MDLREVAVGLYSGDPARFVNDRNAAAAGADDALSRQIRTLRKPTAGAAAVNTLVRENPEVVDAILAVGDRMRAAIEKRDRAAIRDLTLHRQRLLREATAAVSASPAVLREVEETLLAAVVDPGAAAAVRSGMLVRTFASTGVEAMDTLDTVALPGTVLLTPGSEHSRAEPPRTDGDSSAADAATRKRERDRRVRSAQKALDRARAEADRIGDELDDEVDRRDHLVSERDALERRLRRIGGELAESRAAERELRGRVTDAHQAIRAAEKELRNAADD